MLHNEYDDLSKAYYSNLLVVNHYDSNRRDNKNANDLKVGNKIIDEISNTRESIKVYGLPKLVWSTEEKSDQMIIKLKNGYTNASSCNENYITILNHEIMKNKNIRHYYKRKL